MRVILITGGNGGLGLAIASSFLAESDANFLWLGVRKNREGAEALAAANPGRCGCLDLDVTRPEDWRRAVDQILATHECIDVLVNNAGTIRDGLLATLSSDDWHTVLRTNLDGTFYGCQAVLPAMIHQRAGRIINIGSLSGLLPPAGQANYAAAKAGLLAMSQSLAKEVARMNITVNVICPGYVETETLATLDSEQRKAAVARIPMRRFGKPGEVAAATRFLACPDAAYITGSVLKIDGGIF